MSRSPGVLSAAARLALLSAVLAVWVVMLLPNTGLAAIRIRYQPLSQAISWLERVYPPVDMIHVVLFAALGLLLALALPAVRRVTQIWWIALLAAATELVQLWVPGRSAKFGDFAADMAGGAAGLLMGWALIFILVALRGSPRASPHPNQNG